MLFLYFYVQLFMFLFRNEFWTLFHGKANILVLLSNMKKNYHILKCWSLMEQQFLVSESWFPIYLVPQWMSSTEASSLCLPLGITVDQVTVFFSHSQYPF